jgi:hypothetical protein
MADRVCYNQSILLARFTTLSDNACLRHLFHYNPRFFFIALHNYLGTQWLQLASTTAHQTQK